MAFEGTSLLVDLLPEGVTSSSTTGVFVLTILIPLQKLSEYRWQETVDDRSLRKGYRQDTNDKWFVGYFLSVTRLFDDNSVGK